MQQFNPEVPDIFTPSPLSAEKTPRHFSVTCRANSHLIDPGQPECNFANCTVQTWELGLSPRCCTAPLHTANVCDWSTAQLQMAKRQEIENQRLPNLCWKNPIYTYRGNQRGIMNSACENLMQCAVLCFVAQGIYLVKGDEKMQRSLKPVINPSSWLLNSISALFILLTVFMYSKTKSHHALD